jgi:L-iditol 2-dehydrogenase
MLQTVLPQPLELELRDVEIPRPRAGELVIHVRAVTLCGSDVRVWKGEKTGGVTWPAIIGHEMAGEVAAVGAGVAEYDTGDRVSLAPWFTCGTCEYCLSGETNLCENMQVFGYGVSGALAEYVVIPALGVANGQVIKTTDTLPPELSALAEPLACVYHGHARSRITDGSTVLIIGGGPIGLLHLELAVLAGARTIIVSEPSAQRRDFARRHGAHITVDPLTGSLPGVVSDATGRQGVHSTIICIGDSGLVAEAVELTRKGGLINLFAGFGGDGIGALPLNTIHYRQQDVVGNSGATLADYRHAVDLIESGRLDLSEYITDRFPLAELDRALDRAISGDAIKVAVIC